MLFFILIFIGIVWGSIEKKYKIKNNIHIEYIQLNKLYLIYLIGITQFIFRIISNFYNLHSVLIITEIIILLISLIFIYHNRNVYSLLIIETGFILNSIVMLANRGQMPCVSSLDTHLDVRHSLMTYFTHFKSLGDIIYLPYPLDVLAGLYSIGDIIIAIGLMILIKNAYKNKLKLF